MIGLEVPMDWPGWKFVQTRDDGSRDRLDSSARGGRRPLNQARGPLHVVELIGGRMMPHDSQFALIKGGHGPGHRAHRRISVPVLEKDLL